ncbi:MAG: MmgE/PrpD family protein [Marmoricola sp.]
MSPSYDEVVGTIADYVCGPLPEWRAVHLPLVDALACALLASADPECTRVIEPPYSGGDAGGVRVPGTRLSTPPVDAAFATGALVRWLDFNDTWLAQEWGHPSDNLGGLLPLCDHLAGSSRDRRPTTADLMVALAQAYEIQGALAGHTALNRHGLDHTGFVRVATAAVATRLLGGRRDQVAAAVAHAFADAGPLRVFRHAPNVTWRKSWAAGDAVARGLWLAGHAVRVDDAPPRPLTTPGWGLQDALLDGEPILLDGPLGSRVAEGVLLKPWFPGEYHGHSAVEATLTLRERVLPWLTEVSRIDVAACEAAVRIIDKRGPLSGHADRDHCLQYMVAIALLYGAPTGRHYGDVVAADPRIDRLREVTSATEDPAYTRAYHDPGQRAVPARVTIHGPAGLAESSEVWFPVGHPRRRAEATPLVEAKLRRGLQTALPDADHDLATLLLDADALGALPVDVLLDRLTPGA